MIIGTASRLEAFRNLTRYQAGDYDNDTSSRCYWSVFILERTFFPQLPGLPGTREAPGYPLSAPLPPSLPSGRDKGYQSDVMNAEEAVKDLGINAYYLQFLSVWGNVAFYLHEIRSGKVETPCSSDSTYTKLNMMLHELEAQQSQKHLLRNVFFSRRSRAEILQQQEYWRPWIMMEIISHSAVAILNHPFIHLVVLRGKPEVLQSPLFHQQTVDQALYHSGWVFRLVQICEEVGFGIDNPLIGNLVAATSTIPWIFQFSKDPKVSKRADEDIRTGVRLLNRISTTWSLISHKVYYLVTTKFLCWI